MMRWKRISRMKGSGGLLLPFAISKMDRDGGKLYEIDILVEDQASDSGKHMVAGCRWSSALPAIGDEFCFFVCALLYLRSSSTLFFLSLPQSLLDILYLNVKSSQPQHLTWSAYFSLCHIAFEQPLIDGHLPRWNS